MSNLVTVALDAGRELDARIAEHVMGYRWGRFTTPPAGWAGPNGDFLSPWRWLLTSDDRARFPDAIGTETRYLEHLPHFSTDIAAAWLVVEKMETLDPHPWGLTLMNWRYYGDRSVTATFTSHPLGPPSVEERAETAPLAICRAALAARVTEAAR